MTDKNNNTGPPAEPAANPAPTRKIHLTYVHSVKGTGVKHVATTWSELVKKLTAKPVLSPIKPDKGINPYCMWQLFVPFRMKTLEEGAKTRSYDSKIWSRCGENAVFTDFLCLDFDNDPALTSLDETDPRYRKLTTIEDILPQLTGLSFILYTSYNHRNAKKHNVDRFRVLLPLKEPVYFDDFKARDKAVQALFPGADPCSKVISQPFYVPMIHPDREATHFATSGEGEWFDFMALEPSGVKPAPPVPAFVVSGDHHADASTPIRLKKSNLTVSALDLWTEMQEGYEHRVACYRLTGADNKAGCFIIKRGPNLWHHDNDGHKTKIAVFKSTYVGPTDDPNDEDDDEPVQLWQRRKPAAPSAKAKAPSKPFGRKKVLEMDDSFKIITLKDKFLPENTWERIPREGITLIRSPKGTGKTTALRHLVEDAAQRHERVMLLGHRVYLLKHLSDKTNLDYYRDLEDGQTTDGMTLCLNSLTRISQEPGSEYHTLIIDESEQVLQALIGKHIRTEDIATVFQNLIWLFKTCKRIICLDADLTSELTIELINELRTVKDTDDVLGIINDYPIGTGRTTYLYESRFHLLSDCLEAVQAGEKVFIACATRRFATVVGAICKELGKNTLLITSDTNDTDEAQLFIADPTGQSTLYDVVVASPTLSTGVDIQGHHFTRVFGFFDHTPGTYQDADQALSRVRNCDVQRVWIQGNAGTIEVPTEQEIYTKISKKEKLSVKANVGEEVQFTQGQLLWARIYARIAHMVKRWSVNKDEQFFALRTSLGFTLEPVLCHEELEEAGKAIYYGMGEVGLDRAPDIHTAKPLDADEAAEVGRKRSRTRDEQLSLDRFRLEKYLEDDWTVETIRKAIKQELLLSLNRIKTLHEISDEERRSYDMEDRAKTQQAFTHNRHRVMQGELIRHLCKASKLDLDALLKQAQGQEEVEVPKPTLMAIAKAFELRKQDFNFYFDAHIKDPTNEKNVKKVWDATFTESLSLPIIKKKKGPKAAREYRYYLDLSKKDLVHTVRKELSL